MTIQGLKKCLGLALVAMVLGSSSVLAQAAEYVPGEVIVKYKTGIMTTRTEFNALYDSIGVTRVKRFKGMMKGFETLHFDVNSNVRHVIAALERSGLVEYAHPNFIVHAFPTQDSLRTEVAERAPGTAIPCIPGMDIPGCDPNECIIPGFPFPPGCQDGGGGENPPPPGEKPPVQDPPAEVNPPQEDPQVANLYGVKKIGATDAWASGQVGSKNVVVAVIDTGTDYNHEDLSFNMWRNPNPTKGDIVGYDFVHDDGLPFDDHMHGTHTAGTVGAVGGNGVGVSGVSQRVSIMALKFLSAQGSGTINDAIRAIEYAADNGAKIMSNSWGGSGQGEEIKALFDAVEKAKAKGVLFVAAAGNESTNNDDPNKASYPAALTNDNILAVAATDQNDALASFSNYGLKTTHLAAPGVGINSTVPGNKYKAASGTSMACPHVAGAAALLWAAHPEMDYKAVKATLMATVDPVAALKGKTVTGGRLNILKALRSKE